MFEVSEFKLKPIIVVHELVKRFTIFLFFFNSLVQFMYYRVNYNKTTFKIAYLHLSLLSSYSI